MDTDQPTGRIGGEPAGGGSPVVPRTRWFEVPTKGQWWAIGIAFITAAVVSWVATAWGLKTDGAEAYLKSVLLGGSVLGMIVTTVGVIIHIRPRPDLELYAKALTAFSTGFVFLVTLVGLTYAQ